MFHIYTTKNNILKVIFRFTSYRKQLITLKFFFLFIINKPKLEIVYSMYLRIFFMLNNFYNNNNAHLHHF